MESVKDDAITGLDLEPIKRKLMRSNPGKGWPRDRVDAAEKEYRRFLFLMKKFPNDLAAPSLDVDRFWHYHILDTAKYARDCQAVFGYFLHHYPYLGLGGKADEALRLQAGARMRELYQEVFGAQNQQAATGFGAALAKSRDAGDQHANSAMNTLSFCAAPGDRTKDWTARSETDEPDPAGDLLDQIRYVVTENQRYDRVAEPVH